ncbi:MAG: IclR family transcriptional regulator C-terminal domain-containing protein, partial [Mailhella sp.]
LLAYASPKRREKILSKELKPLTDRTITQRAILETQLARVPLDGYASEHEESTRGIHCYSAPIFDYRGENVAAVSMACPYFEFEIPGEPERIIALAKRYAAQMSLALGFQPQN